MIGAAISSRLGSVVSSAVLMREAARTSRRWQTYASRTMFSAVLMGFTVLGIFAATQMSAYDPANMAWLGRGLFMAFAIVQTLLAFVFAPLMVSRAIIEERVDRTVELLVLTRLTPAAVLGAKVLSRVLVLLTLILGALPVLGLIITLGGVSPIEVLAVTTHTLTAVLVLGAMGGFFAVFTRSPFLATAATVVYTVPTFLFLPGLYIMLTGLPEGAAHISPLFGTVSQDWWSLLPIVAYLPVVALLVRVGSSTFQLRVSGARLKRFFQPEVWHTGWFWGVLVVVIVYACTLLPAGVVGSWTYAVSPNLRGSSTLNIALQGISVATVWIWVAGVLYVGTWAYLRVAMDMVMVVDATLSPSGGKKKIRRGPPHIRGNPIVWREVNPRAWRLAVPGLIGWMLVLVVIFQMGIWIIPGGLLGIGAANAAAALLLAVWMGTSTMERERHDGTMELLLTTTLPSWRIVWGKTLGVLAPSMAMLAVSFPMIALGRPHLQLVLDESKTGESFIWGLWVCLWLIPFQLLVLAVAFVVALRLKNAKAAYGVNMALATVFVVVPPLAALLFSDFSFIVVPARLVMPVLSFDATWWEIALSGSVMGFVALVLYIWIAVRLRRWGLSHVQ